MLLWLQKQPLHFWNLKCKRKPTRRSLPLESCQRLRHPPSTELLLRSLLQAFIFSVFYFFLFFIIIHRIPLESDVCASVCVYLIEAVNDKLAASQQAWSRTGGTAFDCLRMCWCSACAVKRCCETKVKGDEGAGVIVASGWEAALWGSHAKLSHKVYYHTSCCRNAELYSVIDTDKDAALMFSFFNIQNFNKVKKCVISEL